MEPLRVGGRRLRQAVRRVQNGTCTFAVGVSVVLGGILAQSSLVTAQTVGPGQGMDAGYFSATGYRIASPALLSYFQHRGGVRTFGYPVSNEFPLLGKRVQIFQRHLLLLDPEGSVSPASILEPDILPITRMDGLSLPAADPDVVGSAPMTSSPEYAEHALAFINVYVPDEWNGLPVNFQSTFLNTVTCSDAFGTDPCEPSLLPAFALELWGLPTSLPTTDPFNSNFVYQRFERGMMHFSRTTGLTQGLLVGDWLKRIIVGTELSSDIGAEVRNSRFFAQYAPTRPLALDRANDLPDTSLAQAFRADAFAAAGQPTDLTPTLPPSVAQTATAVALAATANSLTQTALQGAQAPLTATALALTLTAIPGAGPPTATPSTAVSSVPVVNIGCQGDEQMWFVPRKPNIGVHVTVSVTSQRHHDARAMMLGGPMDSGPVTERVGPLGFVWSWIVVPSVQSFHEWTFYADGLRPCITSGFNAYAPLGATPTPTVTPQPTNTPGPTATPTPTVVAAPTIADVTPSTGLSCSSIITIRGSNFGSPPSQFGTVAFLINGSRSFSLQQIGTGSNTQLRVQMPTSGITPGAASNVQVSNSGGDSVLFPVTFTSC